MTLYAAGNTGYGSAPKVLGSGPSSSLGTFSISYVKPSTPRLLYLVAAGGKSGLVANKAIKLMAAYGMSNVLPAGSVTINELTTVGSVWPMVQFINPSTPQNVGTSATNAQGLANTLGGVRNLVNFPNGQLSNFLVTTAPPLQCSSLTPPANCLTETKLDAFADVAAACVQSSGPSAAFPGDCPSVTGTSPPCDRFLCWANKATDTLGAEVYAALNPTPHAVLHGYPGLVNSGSPYQPIPSSNINDLTLALKFKTGAANNGVAIDALGNAWVVSSALLKLSPPGALLGSFTGGGLGMSSASNGIAIDSLGHVWVANGSGGQLNLGSVSEFSSAGNALSPSIGFSNISTGFCEGAAIDKLGNVWVTNNGTNTLAKLSSAGFFISPSGGYGGGGLNSPHEVAIDGSNNVWVANGKSTFGSISKFNANGGAISPISGYTGGGLSGTHGIAIDRSGHVWAANRSNNTVSEFSSTGVALSPPTGFAGGGLNAPNELEIDSLGHIFIANQGNGTLTELSSTGAPLSPGIGFQAPGGTTFHRLAIDASGDVWATNDDGAHPAVVKFLGIASPVKTPMQGPPVLP